MPYPTELLAHTMTVQSSTNAQDAAGGSVVTYADRATGQACLINTASADEQDRFLQMGMVVSHVIATLYTGAKRGDRVIGYDEAGTEIGRFHVRGIVVQPGVAFVDIPTHVRLYCEEVVD